MTFQQLTYVVEIARCGSINKAAHKLFLSQSGISSAVRELEQELGIQFFVRSSRGVECTPEGEEFLSYAVSLLEQKQRIESLYGEGRSADAPICFSVSTQRYPFTEAAFLRLLERQPPSYRFSMREAGMEAVINDVYEHRADVGVICLTDLTEKIICRLLDSRNLEFHEISAVSPCVYVNAAHPLATKTSVKEEDLYPYPYASFEQAPGVAADFSEEYQIVPARRPQRCISVNSRAVMMNVLSRTDAYTTGSGLLSVGLSTEAVITLPLEDKPSIRIGYILPRSIKLSAHTEDFLSLLKRSVLEAICYTDAMQQQQKEFNLNV